MYSTFVEVEVLPFISMQSAFPNSIWKVMRKIHEELTITTITITTVDNRNQHSAIPCMYMYHYNLGHGKTRINITWLKIFQFKI